MTSTWKPSWAGVLLGVLIAGGAASVSMNSYESASRGGGSYVVLWGAVLFGAALALRSFFRTTGTIEAEQRRRIGESRAQTLRVAMGPAKWEEAKRLEMASAGTLLSDAEIANRIAAGNRAREDERAARWRTNAAALYAPIVEELKGSMSAKAWDEKRADALWSMKSSREAARRYWREQAPGLPPELQRLPRDLDPTLDPVAAEDWQVAMHIRPMKLDGEGHPVTAAP